MKELKKEQMAEIEREATEFAIKIQTKPGTSSRLNAIEWYKAGAFFGYSLQRPNQDELNKEQLAVIEREAEQLYPKLLGDKRKAYTAAASKYLLQNIGLHDKLQKSLNQNANDTLRIKELEDGLRNLRHGLFKDVDTVNEYIESLLK